MRIIERTATEMRCCKDLQAWILYHTLSLYVCQKTHCHIATTHFHIARYFPEDDIRLLMHVEQSLMN